MVVPLQSRAAENKRKYWEAWILQTGPTTWLPDAEVATFQDNPDFELAGRTDRRRAAMDQKDMRCRGGMVAAG